MIRWRLLHWLFGWHFVAVEFGFDMLVRRIHLTTSKQAIVNCYGKIIVLSENSQRQWIALTFDKGEFLSFYKDGVKPEVVRFPKSRA